MRQGLRMALISLGGLGEIVSKVPLPVAFSLDIALWLAYSDTIWREKRNSRFKESYSANRNYVASQSKKYSRRMNQGARD
ncbi:MAG: hypothetical protein AABX91_03400 [Nanoarchaeota archaeon]